MYLKITHRIESTAGHFTRTVRQEEFNSERWEVLNESNRVVASTGNEELALIIAKREVYGLDIARLEQELATDNRIAMLLEMLGEELAELTNRALAIVNPR